MNSHDDVLGLLVELLGLLLEPLLVGELVQRHGGGRRRGGGRPDPVLVLPRLQLVLLHGRGYTINSVAERRL